MVGDEVEQDANVIDRDGGVHKDQPEAVESCHRLVADKGGAISLHSSLGGRCDGVERPMLLFGERSEIERAKLGGHPGGANIGEVAGCDRRQIISVGDQESGMIGQGDGMLNTGPHAVITARLPRQPGLERINPAPALDGPIAGIEVAVRLVRLEEIVDTRCERRREACWFSHQQRRALLCHARHLVQVPHHRISAFDPGTTVALGGGEKGGASVGSIDVQPDALF